MDTIIGTDIDLAIQFLNKGELVAIPTETVYGLAANALNPDAVIKIYEVKKRPRFNPLIVHFFSFDECHAYVTDLPESALKLAEVFSPGPLSFLLPKSDKIPDIITAGSDHVVVRIPDHPIAQSLLEKLNFPLAAPSANPFGYISPVTAQHVYDGLKGEIPYILDGGKCKVGLESTIVGFSGDDIIIHRLGGISVEDIKKVTGKNTLLSLLHKQPKTPGQLKSHYAPDTMMLQGNVDELIQKNKGKRIAVISFQKEYKNCERCYVLSQGGDLHEAASNLFKTLRELDKLEMDLLLVEKFPEIGIGMAINDRLSRAVMQ